VVDTETGGVPVSVGWTFRTVEVELYAVHDTLPVVPCVGVVTSV
jgi:hypothetical protein